MKEVLEFIFQDFWHYIGFWILLATIRGSFITIKYPTKKLLSYFKDKELK